MVRRGARSWNLIDKWKNLKLRLEHELGPAKIDGATDDEVQRLVFHPQEHRSSPARILKHSRVQRREQLKVATNGIVGGIGDDGARRNQLRTHR